MVIPYAYMRMRVCSIRVWYKYAYGTNRDNKIATSAKLLDIVYKSYRFIADLIEAVN